MNSTYGYINYEMYDLHVVHMFYMWFEKQTKEHIYSVVIWSLFIKNS